MSFTKGYDTTARALMWFLGALLALMLFAIFGISIGLTAYAILKLDILNIILNGVVAFVALTLLESSETKKP